MRLLAIVWCLMVVVLERQELAIVWCLTVVHASAATPIDALIVEPIPIQHERLATFPATMTESDARDLDEICVCVITTDVQAYKARMTITNKDGEKHKETRVV